MLDLPPIVDRRSFMKLMSASIALAGGACTRAPLEPIVPYARQPEGTVQGEPLYFATALTRGGYAHGVLVESNMGRPTKIEGNPAHPASLGSTGPMEQGRILELWDPDRSRAIQHAGQIDSWENLADVLRTRAQRWQANGGEGLRILAGGLSSPTLLAQWRSLLAKYPRAQLHHYEPVNRDNVYAGTRASFGRALEPIYHFDRARVIVSLESDFLGRLPGHIRYARDFARTRRPEARAMSRLYVVECMPSITGAAADHRLPLRSGDVRELAGRLTAAITGGQTPTDASPWLRAALSDLNAHRGASLILAGDEQPPQVHAMAHHLNEVLGNRGSTVDCIALPVTTAESNRESLTRLVEDMRGGHVDTLLILGGNPVYDAPVDAGFAEALRFTGVSIHFGLHDNESSRRCTWHVPAAHELETWSDATAYDGTITIQQPLIAPLYGGRPIHEMLAALAGDFDSTAHSLVRDYWMRSFGDQQPAERWGSYLRSGVVADSAAHYENTGAAKPFAQPVAAASDAKSIEVAFRPDPTLWDGRYANVAWLQELPKPMTQLTWDNAAMMSDALAQELHLNVEDVVEIEVAGRTLRAPVWIVPHHAERAVTLYLGSGRTAAGSVGTGCGVNAFALRTLDAPWFVDGSKLRKLNEHYPLATTQSHHRLEGRPIVRTGTLTDYLRDPQFAREESDAQAASLYPDAPREQYAWGMSIDLASCIGCGACTIACQAENNIPTVGKSEIRAGREMHWIRVDRYEDAAAGSQRTLFQPVPCMQCEHAPCELVCPVEASVHDTEGINVQVYNRCVGTRFCSNNCPYKVRRFNFLQYSKEDAQSAAVQNPEVTVRMRGVMEKCNYCLQRVVRGRITADREDRVLRDGEVVTACQAVCPTQAIVFGNLNDPNSAVRAAKGSARTYTLLGELNTRPRTTYLTRIVNPAQDGEKG
jgi:Fe-S-cluster-containing dehydrogenase component/anaerobic selenocysteine-containing dehydrogenase